MSTFTKRCLTRGAIRTAWLALALVAALAHATQAAAATRLFVVITGEGTISELDPATGEEIASLPIAGFGSSPGLAYNGSELFYTDDSLPTIHVYSEAGVLLRQLPKPAGKGAGMGVSSSSLYVVGSDDDVITAISPIDGTVQSSIGVPGAKQALTYAGSRGTLFVRVGDEGAGVAEVALNGTVLHSFVTPVPLNGLAFSSSSNRLYGVVSGLLWAFNPDTGAVLAGYPVQVTDAVGNPRDSTGGAAADEVAVVTAKVTRPAKFWRQYPAVITGTFDGSSGAGSLLPIDLCGAKIKNVCEAVVVMSLPGGGILQFAREAVAATLNCRAFKNCTPEVLDVIKAGSDACARGNRRFNYGAAGVALAHYNGSGASLPLPFNPGKAQPLYCLGKR